MSTSRETARDALVTLLTAALVGAGLPAKTVTGSKVTELAGQTPLVMVLSGGSGRERLTYQGDQTTFMLEVMVFVRQATTGWTNAQAEDALDRIESLIAGAYEAAGRTADWEFVRYTAATKVYEVAVEGVAYYMERIPTTVELARS